MNGKLFMGKIHVQNRNRPIVGDSVRKLPYDIPERNFHYPYVSRSYDKLTIIV